MRPPATEGGGEGGGVGGGEGSHCNIYEEIIPPHRRLFYSISQGRRDNLELYKFADWDLEDKLRPKIDKVTRGNKSVFNLI